jgi:sugar/nucleoside kinase (ribokinase family)
MEIGPGIVVAKRGEYGAALFTQNGFFAIPGYLLEDVRDPTGAGDSFAGGFLGYLDGHASEPTSEDDLRRAMAYGSVLASFNVEDFGTERVRRLTLEEIEERVRDFKRLTHFDEGPVGAG